MILSPSTGEKEQLGIAVGGWTRLADRRESPALWLSQLRWEPPICKYLQVFSLGSICPEKMSPLSAQHPRSQVGEGAGNLLFKDVVFTGSSFPIWQSLSAYSCARHPPNHSLSGSVSLKKPLQQPPAFNLPPHSCRPPRCRCTRPLRSLCRHSGSPPAKPGRLSARDSAGVSNPQSASLRRAELSTS